MSRDCIIQQHKSLCELYGDLLVKARRIAKLDSDGTVNCQRCGKSKGMHLGDMRCCVSSQNMFLSVDHEDAAKINRAILLIEELREIDG